MAIKMDKIISIIIAAVIGTSACSGLPKTEENPLSGKTVAFVGDSISYGTNCSGGYGKIIGEMENMTVSNPSIGGSTLAQNVSFEGDAVAVRPSILDITKNLEGDYDYIIFEGGINDFWTHAKFGEITDTFDGGYDGETTTGALESMFFEAREKHPQSKVGFVIIHDPFLYDAENDFLKYYEMIKAVCDKWEVPYLDLYARNNQTTGVNVRDSEQRKLYFASEERPEGDGCHPNEQGYRTIYVEPMIEWMRGL